MFNGVPKRAFAREMFIRSVTGISAASVITGCFAISGCTWFDTDARRGYEIVRSRDGDPTDATIFTTADVRVISQRKHPVTQQVITCTEPTPDVAKALSTAAQIGLKGGNKAANGAVDSAGGSAEAVAKLAGRSTALLALRDGLFRACEAYKNGAIGSNAYALVLSRYGQLMTTLFLAEDVQAAARSSNTASSPPVNLPGGNDKGSGNSSGSGGSSGGSSGGGGSGSGGSSSGSSSGSGGGNTEGGVLSRQALPAIKAAGFLRVAAQGGKKGSDSGTSSGNPGASGGSGSSSGSGSSGGSSGSSGNGNGASSGRSSGGPGSGTSGAADALVALDRLYVDLDTNFVHQLVVACVNEYDPTRKRAEVSNNGSGASVGNRGSGVVEPPIPDEPGHNAYLRSLCTGISTLDKINRLTKASGDSPRPRDLPK